MAKVERRDCPKSLGGARGVALRSAEKALSDPIGLLIAAESALGVLLGPLFGQSRKVNSPKFAEKVPKLAHLGYALSYGVGYKGKVHQAISDQPNAW